MKWKLFPKEKNKIQTLWYTSACELTSVGKNEVTPYWNNPLETIETPSFTLSCDEKSIPNAPKYKK